MSASEFDREKRRNELETIIDDGIRTFYAVGMALEEISESELYKDVGFDSFEDYCRAKWNYGLARPPGGISSRR